ncbi:MAG TPA: hypothetical protein VGI71_16230 [Scandinavium sp.]|jgi:hypothetical protein
MSGFYIDTEALRSVKAALGASESQMVAAFHKALRQTVNKLYKESVVLMFSDVGAKNRKVVQRRIRQSTKKVSGNQPGTGKVWFGLNDMPVSTLKGRIKNPRIRRQRDAKGRFITAKGSRGATFTPKSPHLNAVTFLNSFGATVRGKRSIWIRQDNGHVAEARIAVYNPMVAAVQSDLFGHAGETLMDYFTKDLRGRVAGNV